MAARLKSHPSGYRSEASKSVLKTYENTAFSYRYLDTDKNPLELMNEAFSGLRHPALRPGQYLWNTYGKPGMSNPALFYTGKHYDDTYRILADEFYRERE